VERVRADTPHRVIYVDAGDVEETTTRLSNLTRGVAMHRMLSAAGCEVAAVGNAVWIRYGTHVVAEQAQAAAYPLLLANLVPVEGTQETVIIDGVGFLGVTDPFRRFLDGGGVDFGIRALEEVDVVRRCARELREQGAELVVCLSHLGLEVGAERRDRVVTDREVAQLVQGEVDVIIGAHSHDLLPDGEWIGSVLVTQVGCFGEHVGRIDIDDGAISASVIPVTDDIPLHPGVIGAVEAAERDLDESLGEVIADLDKPLDAQWVAEMLRQRMGADVGLATSAVVLERSLPAGPLRRGDLWEACHSTANPAAAQVSGERLQQLISRGNDPEFQRSTSRSLRGRPRGRLHVAGAHDIDPARTYVVAATDFELEPYGEIVGEDWDLQVRYDFPTIIREAIEEHLTAGP
jgi:2',3'-cyclic-nucleotide 2'-phosphodiesterase (5'-nucleotidase family)